MMQRPANLFETVRRIGVTLPNVEPAIRYDGAPILKANGRFMAGLASHPSAEPQTLVVKIGIDDREALLEEAPETYYVTDYYRPHPVVLVRLSRIDREALRDLLSMSWRAVRRGSEPSRAQSREDGMSSNLPRSGRR